LISEEIFAEIFTPGNLGKKGIFDENKNKKHSGEH
jgi:hypothetical protein